MASSYTGLGTELMTTGENAGNWGTKTNTNLQIIEQIAGGYVEQDVAGGAQTTTLSVSDGSTGATLGHRVIKFTGTITGNQTVTIPLDVQQMYVLVNGTSGAYTVQFKYATGSGSSVTFGTTDKGTKIVYATADHATNPNLVDTGISTNTITGVTGDITLDSPDDIVIDAAGGNIEFKDAGTTQLLLDMDTTAGDQIIQLKVDSDDLVFKQYDGNEVMRIADNRKVYFYDEGGEHISSDGTDFTFASGNDINLTATTDINVPANVGITFGDDAEKIEGDGTDLTVTGNNIKLTATADVVLAANTGLVLDGSGNEKIESDGTDITVSVGSGGDINVGANIGVTFGDDGEKIEGDGTDLTISASADLNLTATTDINIPANVGLTFGDDGEKIEGDGTDLTISANNLTVDAAADITLDAGGADLVFADDGTNLLKISNSSSDVIFQPQVDAKDIKFNQYDGRTLLDINDGGFVAIANGATGSGELRIYEDTDAGSNYTGFKVGTQSGDVDYVLPTADGSSGQHLTTNGSGTLSWSSASISSLAADDIAAGDAAVTIGNGSTSADVTIDSGDDVVIDAAGGNVEFKDAGTLQLSLDMDGTAGVQIIKLGVDSDDLVFQQYDGNEVMRINDDRKLYFYDDGGEHISSDGTDFTFASGNDINLTATTDINVPANVGMTFGNDAEKIEGDGTDLTISGNNINLTATADVNIPSGVGLTFATAEKIESDGTDLTFTVGSNGDINIGANIGVTFGDDGEKIEGDGTDLTITGNNIKLTATADVILAANTGLVLDGSGDEKIESDGTDISFSVGSSGDINIPANIGLTFGDDGEKIEGDGTDLTISANNLTIDCAADLILDAGGNDFNFKAGGTEVLRISNSSSDVIIKPIVDAKDIIFQQRDGTEVARVEDNGTFNIVTDKLAINGTAVTSTAAELNKLDGAGTIKEAGLETIWIPANAMTPTTSNGCASIASVETTAGRPDMYVLDFDKDADEHAQFTVAFPKQWNLGTVTFQVFWSGTANTGGVSWGLQGVACGDNDTIDVAYGTGVVVDDAEQGALEEVNVSAVSGAVTIAGSPADDQLCYFRIYRDVSDANDDSSGDARLHGIKLFFTTDAKNDS